MKLKRTLVENAFRRLLYCTKTSVESFVEYEYGNQHNYVEFMRYVLLGQKMVRLPISFALPKDALLQLGENTGNTALQLMGTGFFGYCVWR